MAFIDDDLENEDQQQLGGGQAPLVGGGSNAAGSGVSQAGVGAGGTGGWTNIQAYLNANKGDTGSSQALQSEVGEQFNKERDAFKTDSSKFLSDAEKQLGESKVTSDQAGEMVKQGAANYDWGGQQKTAYTDNVNKIQGFLTKDYQGPKSYDYGFNSQTQNYGQAMNDPSSFDSVMNNVYSKKANSPLTSGQFQLQKQLDVNNENLVNTRKNLGQQYEGLTAERDNVVKDTTAKLGGYEQDYRTGQNALRDYLTNQSGDYDTKIAQQEGAAKSEYDKLFNTGQTGNASVGWEFGIGGTNAARRAHLGILGDNLTWNQLEKENRAVTPNQGGYNNEVRPDSVSWYDPRNDIGRTQRQLDARRGQLDAFYGEQDSKYANVADEDERAYNTIQDFLNSGAEKKKQGFRVRG